MTPQEFCYWLMGYFAISDCVPRPAEPHGVDGLNSEQVEIIKQHLALAFRPEAVPNPPSKEHFFDSSGYDKAVRD